MASRSSLCVTSSSKVFLLSFLIPFCAAVLLRSEPARRAPSQIPESNCTFAGNSDLYGLGIRIGIYLQWISGFLAICFHAESVPGTLSTNTIFLLALFIALAIITTNHTVTAPEVIILLQFCFGFLFSVSSTWGLRVKTRIASPKRYKERVEFPLLGSTIRIFLGSAICFYNVWFWFVGIDKLRDPACHPIGFLFARVDLMDGARVFLKIVAVLATIAYGSTTISELLFFFCNWALYVYVTWLIAILVAFHRKSSVVQTSLLSWSFQGIVLRFSFLVGGRGVG